MVEEQFKLGLTVEIEQKGLPELRKLINKEVEAAISVSGDRIAKGAKGKGTRAAPGISSTAIKSALEAVTVSSKDLSKKVASLASAVSSLESSADQNSASHKAAADKIDAAIKRLIGALSSGGGAVGGGAGGAGGAGGGGRGGPPGDDKKLKAARRNAAKELERSAAAEKAVSNNLVKFDVNLAQDTKELAALQSDLSTARKAVKSFQAKLKSSEKEIEARKGEGRGTKAVGKKLEKDKGQLAALKADEKSLREAVGVRKKQVGAVERLISAAERHTQSLRAAEEAVSGVSTSSKATAAQMNSASAILKKTTSDLSGISSAADSLAAEIGTGTAATTDLAKRVRATAAQMTQRGKVISDENKESARLRKEKTKVAVAERKSEKATQDSIKATKADTQATKKLSKAKQKEAARTAILAEGKVGAGVKPGLASRAAKKAKAREKTTADTALAAKGTGKAIAQVKQARAEEARAPQQLREAKGPGGKKKGTGAPEVDAGPAERYLAGADVGAKRMNAAVAAFEARVKSIFPNRPKVMEEVGFKDIKAQVTEGASVGIRDKAGQIKLMKGTVEVFEGRVQKVGDVLSDLLNKLSDPESPEMGRVESTSRFRESAAMDMLKGMIGPSMQKMDVMKQGTVGGPLAQGGKVIGRVRLTKEQSEEATGFKDDKRQLIMMVNRILDNLAKGTDKLAAAGYDEKLTSVGLSEGTAPKIETVMKGKKVSELIAPLQARELSQFVPMGAEGMKEQRIPPQFAAGQMIGGEPPAWSPAAMKGLISKGLVAKEQGKELRAAAVTMPESMEDQIPISRAAAEKLAVKSFDSVTVDELGTAIKTGVKLLEDKIIGKMGEVPIKFELGSAYEAQVKEVRQIMVDGIKRYRVLLEKSTVEGLGGKIQTMGGLKGKTVVHEDLGKTAAGEPIEIIIDPKSMAARGDPQDPTSMMASAISEATGGETSVQAAGDLLAEELKIVGGKAKASLTEAVKKVSEGLGLKGFTGTQKITGGLIGKGAGKKGVEALTGKIHVRVAQDQVKKEAQVKERFWSATDLASMEMAGMAETVAHFKKSMDEAQHENEDLVQSIIVLTSSFEQQTALLDKEGIMPVSPSEFAALPMGAKGKAEAFKGTLVDPESAQNQAAAMLLPRRGGQHGALRMGPVGKQLGGRGTFETKEGEVSANKLSRSLDKIRELSTAIMVRRGEVDIAETPEAVQEAASMGDEAINAFAKSLQDRLQKDPGDETAIQEFDDLVAAMSPFIDSIQDAGKYIKYWSGGKAVPRKGEGGATLSGRGYVAQAGTGPDVATQKRNKVLAMRDLLFRRTTGGAKDKSVPGKGKLFETENVDELRDALSLLGVTFNETGKRVKDLYSQLYGKRDDATGKKVGQGEVDKYYGDLAQQVSARNKPPDPMKRSLMQQISGGRSLGMRGRAFAVPGQVAPQLEEARKALQRLGQTGTDVGQALGAVGEMEKLQTADVLPKDAIVVNRKDFEMWVDKLVKFEGVDADTARKNIMEQGVVLHRDPTTGGASMQQRKLMIDEGGRVGRGEIGVAGTFREGPGQMGKIMAPLSKELSRLRGILKEKGGATDPGMDKIRKDFASLSSLIDNLMNVFTSLGMNLDFDGDQIEIHTKKTRDAAGALEQLAAGAEAAWGSFNKIISAAPGTVQGSTLESLDETFKERMPEGVALKPQTAEQKQANVSGLISGKLLVGMSTEVHHRFLKAIMSGIEETDWSGAFKAVLGRLMLNINEALKMKHAGKAGAEKFEPGTMIDMIRKGDTKGLGKAVGKGGEYEKLGEFNKKFVAEQQDQLLALSPDKLAGGLEARGLEDVIPKEGVSAENYQGVIKSALKKMDIKTVFKEMNQTLVQGYARSLEESGMDKKEIKAKIKEKLKGKGGRKPAGIPMDEVIAGTDKPWLATRGKFQKKMKSSKGLGQLKELLAFLPKDLLKNVSEVMDLDDIDIDRESMVKATGIEGFAANLRKSIMAVRNSLGDRLEVAKMPAGVAGRYVEGAEGEAGGKGRIQTSSKTMEELEQGLEALSQIEAGTFTGTAEKAMKSLRGIQKFLGTLAHERVHQLGAGKGAAQLSAVRSSLTSPRGALGKQSEAIKERMIENVPNVRKLAGRVEEWKAKAGEDPDKQRRAKIAGKDVTGTAGEIAEKLGGQLNNLIAEELLAYLAEGRLEDAIGDLDLGKGLDFLVKRVRELGEKDKEILGAAQASGQRITSSALEGILSGLEGEGVGRGDAKARMGTRQIGAVLPGGTPAIDRETQNKLAGLERVVTEASTVAEFKIGAVDPELAAAGKLGLVGAEPIRSRFEEETEQVGRVNELIEKARTTGIDKEEQKEIEATAKMFKKDKGDEGGWDMYQKAIRQMHAAKSTFLINQAREIESRMEVLTETGQAGGPEFRSLGPKLKTKVENLQKFLLETTQKIGTVPNLAMAKGGPTSAAYAADIVPGEQVVEQAIVRARGRGKGPAAQDEAKRFEKSEEVLRGMFTAIEKNVSASEQMAVVWEHIKEDPKIATERLKKMAGVTSTWVQTLRQMGKTAAADKMQDLAKWIKQMATSMATMSDPSLEGMLSRLPKGQQQMVGAGPAGAGLVMPMTDQMDSFEIKVKAHRKRLQALMESPQFKKMGLKPDFEPMKADMIDPKTNQQVQKLQANFKKVGKTIEYSMEQGGVATQRFGRRLKDAFRRVVQWGFATGIIYGTMRAFRSLSTVLTDVQDRVFALKKVMDVTITDFVQLQDEAVSMAKNYGIAINEVLDGMVVYGQQGLKINAIMERTQATMMAVNVTTLDSTGATEALTAAHKIFGGEISNSMGFVDAWAKVAAKHAITAKDLADVVKKAGAAAGVAGMNFEDFMGITTAIGVVSRQTGKEIGTSLKFMMRGMRRPVAQKEFASLGIASLTETGDLRPAMDILKELAGAWGTLSKAQQLATAQAAAGIRHYNSFIILMNNFDEALEASAHAATSQGFAMRKNALAMQTMSKQMAVLRETVKGLGLEIGKAIVPTVTAATKALTVLVDVVGKIPGPMLQIGTLGLAGMLAFHKAADMVVDSLDAMMGYGAEGPKLKKFFGAEGYIGGMGKGIKKAAKGIFGGIGTGLSMMMAKLVDFGPTGMKPTGVFDPKEQGLIVRGLAGMKNGVVALASSLGALRMIALGVTGAFIAIAGVLLYKWYQRVTATGQDMADMMHDQIGKAQDLADSYRSQATELGRVALAQKKLALARELSADDPKMGRAIAAGEFKGAALAARDLHDVTIGVGKAIAKIDPTSITGITDSGELVWDMSAGFESLTGSAVEAQTAIFALMQVKVMKAFADDINEAQGALDNWSETWNKLMQNIGMDPLDLSLAGQLKESQKALQKISALRREAADHGWDAVGLEEQHIVELEKHLGIQEKIGVSAIKLKEILDQMPTFESFETFKAIAGKDYWTSLQTGAASGKFGEGATASSLAFNQMAKGTAAGELTDYRSAANPAWMIEGLLEKGVRPEVYGAGGSRGYATAADIMPTGTGEILVASRAFAEALLKEATPELAALDKLDPVRTAAITAMQSLLSEVDKDTGAAIWKWSNALSGGVESASVDMLAKVMATVDKTEHRFAIFRAKAIEEAAQATQRLLTMAFTGAMAGIRDPGAFNIGPASRKELTAEQRVMEALPLTLQRLVDLQKEMAEIQRTYNELLGEGNIEQASAQMAKSAGAVKVMDAELKELVMTLQGEGFEISRALHYNMAIQDLNKTLEEAAIVAGDAARAEERRTEFVRHTSGALLGLAELPNLTFGKSKKDLTGLERLQERMPGLAKIVKGFDSLLKKRDTMMGSLSDVDARTAAFERSMNDLAASGEKLSDEQLQVRAVQLSKGIGEGDRAILQTMRDIGESQIDYARSQTDIMSSILDILSIEAVDTRNLSREEMLAHNKRLEDTLKDVGRVQLEAAARELPASVRRRALAGATGLEMIPRDQREESGILDRPPTAFKINEGTAAAMFGVEYKDVPDQFKDLVKKLMDVKQEILDASSIAGVFAPQNLEQLSAQEDDIIKQLMDIQKVRDTYKNQLKTELGHYIGANRSARMQTEIAEAQSRTQRAAIETAKQQLLASKYFSTAKIALISQLTDAQSALERAGPHLRLSEAAENLAKSLEDLIADFKKAEMLELDPKRMKSDLEGPFARVGKPGFKTDFEIRREEAEAKLSGGSREDRKAAQEELEKIEFDIDEARIKKKQDIEIKALKQQQAQAEKFRDIMAEAMLSGEYAGEEIEGRLKNFFNVLGDELEVAEEATVRGDKLSFKGLPSLQNAKGLISELKNFAEKKAKLAEYQIFKKAFEEGGMKDVVAATRNIAASADETNTELDAQTAHLARIVALMQGGELGERLAGALGVLTTELSRLREVQRTQNAQSAPESAMAVNMAHGGMVSRRRMAHGGLVPGPRTSEKDTVPAMLTPGEEVLTERQADAVRQRLKMAHGGIVPGLGGEISSGASAIRIPTDQLVKELYEFQDGMHAIVTRLKRPGGEGMIVGSQTFEIKNGIIEMGDTAVVDEGFRRQGIGPDQLEEVIRTAKAQGIETISASELSVTEGQRTAYTKAARATGAEVKMAKLDTQIEYDPSSKTYGAQQGYEGRILELDLKNVEMDIERGFKSGFKKGSQEFLEHLEDRLALASDQMPPSQIKAAARAQEAKFAALDAEDVVRRAGAGGLEGKVVSDKLTTAPRSIEAQLEGQAPWVREEVMGNVSQINETGDIPGRGPRAIAANMRSVSEAGLPSQIMRDIQGGPAVIQGERGGFFEAEGLTPESPEFEIRRAEEELRRNTAAHEAQADADARARAATKDAERARKSRVGVDVDEYGQFTDESIPDELPDKAQRLQRMAEAAEPEKPSQWTLTDKSKGKISPKLKGFFSTFGKILAPIGSLLQGMNIGGLAHKSERGMVDQDEIAEELGREVGIAGLATAGALGGAALGGPLGGLLGGLGGAGIGMLDQFAGTDYTGKLGKAADKFSGGSISGTFQEFSQSGLTTGLGDLLGENASSDSWIANAQLPTWLGGADYGARAEMPATPQTVGAPATPPPAPAPAPVAPGPRTQEQWMQRIAEIQTAAPSGFEMSGATGKDFDPTKMFLPSQFAPGSPLGTATPKVSQGTARTDYTGDAGFFTQAQQFKAAGSGATGPRQAFEGVRSTIDEAGATQEILKALAAGVRVFKPTDPGVAGRDPFAGAGSAQQYIENLQSARARAQEHYGGASNQGLVNDANAQQRLGTPVTSAQPTLSATGQLQQRGTSEIVAREDAATATRDAGSGEASQAVAQALESINATLAALSQNGLTIPDSLATTIAAGSEAVVTKLGDVNITSLPPVDITAASISNIGTSVGTAVAGAGVGAQQIIDIDELKNELLEPEGAIDTRIIQSTEAFETRIAAGEAESIELKGLVDINTSDIGTISNETIPGIEIDITELTAADVDLLLKADGNAIEINTLNAEVTRVAGVADTTSDTVTTLQSSVEGVLITSDQVITSVGQFEEELITISADSALAAAAAAGAVSATADLQSSLNNFRDELQAKDAQIESTIRTARNATRTLKGELDTDIKPDIFTLQKKVATNAATIVGLAARKQDK